MSEYKVKVLVDMMADKLIQHLTALERLEELSKNQEVEPVEIGSHLSRLRGLRDSLIRDAERALELIKGGEIPRGGEHSEELYALAGYYVEGAYHKETRILDRLGGALREDHEQIERLKNVLKQIMEKLE